MIVLEVCIRQFIIKFELVGSTSNGGNFLGFYDIHPGEINSGDKNPGVIVAGVNVAGVNVVKPHFNSNKNNSIAKMSRSFATYKMNYEYFTLWA